MIGMQKIEHLNRGARRMRLKRLFDGQPSTFSMQDGSHKCTNTLKSQKNFLSEVKKCTLPALFLKPPA